MSFKDDIFDFYLSVKFELMKHQKRGRLLIIVALAIFLPLISYVIPPIFNIDYSASAYEFANENLSTLDMLIVVSVSLFAGDAVSSEFEKKTGLLLFPTPQRRTSIFVGKYFAALMVSFLVVSLYYFVTVLEIVEIYGVSEIPAELTKSYLVALLFVASAVSLIYFFSCVFKRTVTSTLFGFFFLLLIMPMIANVLLVVDVEPWFLVTYSAGLITYVLGFEREIRGPTEDYISGGYQPDLFVGTLVMTAYAIIFFLISIVIANRKKME